MSSKIFTDADGNFLGVFGDGAEPPEGAIEIEEAPITGYQVDAECERRLFEFVGARDGSHFDRIQTDGMFDALDLINKKERGETLSLEDIQREQEIIAFRTVKTQITNSCKAIKSMIPVPKDYRDNRYWD